MYVPASTEICVNRFTTVRIRVVFVKSPFALRRSTAALAVEGSRFVLTAATKSSNRTACLFPKRLADRCSAVRSISLDVRPMLRTATIVCLIWPSYSGPIIPPLMLWPRPCKDAREVCEVGFLIFVSVEVQHFIWLWSYDLAAEVIERNRLRWFTAVTAENRRDGVNV
jgi:hypothetical protein